MNLTKQQRVELRFKFGGNCAYCGCLLPEKGWHADHVEPVLREWWKRREYWKQRNEGKAGLLCPENDNIDNLFPSCAPCNIDKHATPLELWRKQIEDRVDVCRRNYSAFRHAERFGLLKEIKKPVVFWFEQFEVTI